MVDQDDLKIQKEVFHGGEKPEKVSEGYFLVKWPITSKPKNKGGLGISDLEPFDGF